MRTSYTLPFRPRYAADMTSEENDGQINEYFAVSTLIRMIIQAKLANRLCVTGEEKIS
jgi:hypothetical protein